MTGDDEPTRRRPRLEIQPLDTLGIAELETYVGELRAEIARAEAAIENRRAHRGAADRIFGRPPAQEDP